MLLVLSEARQKPWKARLKCVFNVVIAANWSNAGCLLDDQSRLSLTAMSEAGGKGSGPRKKLDLTLSQNPSPGLAVLPAPPLSASASKQPSARWQVADMNVVRGPPASRSRMHASPSKVRAPAHVGRIRHKHMLPSPRARHAP
jgi:hypothetical protein